ncbi:MAG TPA: hypothetical protein PLN83_01855 [Syntrophorhabdus sp.]|nr:hypothetical protein [Syntrophorhabdus sp.]
MPQSSVVHAGVVGSLRADVGPVVIAQIVHEVNVVKLGTGVVK